MRKYSDSSRGLPEARACFSAHKQLMARANSAILHGDDQPVLQPTREQGACDLRSPGRFCSLRDGRTYRREARSVTRHQESVLLYRIYTPKMRCEFFAPDP